jgi:hypothetical protein
MISDLDLPRAIFDESRVYRYLLRRPDLGGGRPGLGLSLGGVVLFVPLNPSKADERVDDPSVRRMIGFARGWGFRMLEVANIFALRTTNPLELYEHPDPIGPENDDHIRAAVDRAGIVVCAWGNHGEFMDRGAAVLQLIRQGIDPWLIRCLGVNMSGQPRHPLYVAAATGPVTYPRTAPPINTQSGRP